MTRQQEQQIRLFQIRCSYKIDHNKVILQILERKCKTHIENGEENEKQSLFYKYLIKFTKTSLIVQIHIHNRNKGEALENLKKLKHLGNLALDLLMVDKIFNNNALQNCYSGRLKEDIDVLEKTMESPPSYYWK